MNACIHMEVHPPAGRPPHDRSRSIYPSDCPPNPPNPSPLTLLHPSTTDPPSPPLRRPAGHGHDLLRAFIRALPRTRPWAHARASATSEFHVDHAFRVSGVGTVLAGAVHRGTLAVGAQLLLGPDRLLTGAFRPVVVRCVRACVFLWAAPPPPACRGGCRQTVRQTARHLISSRRAP